MDHFNKNNGSPHAPTSSVMSSRPVKFSGYIILQFPNVLVSCTLASVFSLPHFLCGHWLLVSYTLSKTLRAAFSSVYFNHPQ